MISRSLILQILQAAKIMRAFFYGAPAEIMQMSLKPNHQNEAQLSKFVKRSVQWGKGSGQNIYVLRGTISFRFAENQIYCFCKIVACRRKCFHVKKLCFNFRSKVQHKSVVFLFRTVTAELIPLKLTTNIISYLGLILIFLY